MLNKVSFDKVFTVNTKFPILSDLMIVNLKEQHEIIKIKNMIPEEKNYAQNFIWYGIFNNYFDNIMHIESWMIPEGIVIVNVALYIEDNIDANLINKQMQSHKKLLESMEKKYKNLKILRNEYNSFLNVYIYHIKFVDNINQYEYMRNNFILLPISK